MRSATTQRVVVAAATAVASVPVTYALQRGYDALFRMEPNPATVIWSARVAMFWRLGVAAYVAGMIAALAYFVAGLSLPKAVRALYFTFAVGAVLLGAQGALLP
jgi:hypothetical protein